MAKTREPKEDAPRQRRARPAGELVGDIGGVAFKRFGFIQGSVVARWKEIVGERYAKVSVPESIRFPTGKREDGTLTLLVEGAHAPLMQHLGPMIIEKVNRFFGYHAISKIAYRQGRIPANGPKLSRPKPVAVPEELGEGLREIVDPELKAVLESLAGHVARTSGPPKVEPSETKSIPIIRSIK